MGVLFLKKKYLFLTLALILIFSTGAFAKGLEFVGGVTYNSFEPEAKITNNDYEGSITIGFDGQDGTGYFIGGRYWFSEKLGVGLGYDVANSKSSFNYKIDDGLDYLKIVLKEEAELAGPYAEILYKVNNVLTFSGAIVNYNLVVDGSSYYEESYGSYEDEYDNEYSNEEHKKLLEGEGTGYILNTELNYPFKENFAFKVTAGYRKATINVEEFLDTNIPDNTNVELDLSGLRFTAGLSFDF